MLPVCLTESTGDVKGCSWFEDRKCWAVWSNILMDAEEANGILSTNFIDHFTTSCENLCRRCVEKAGRGKKKNCSKRCKESADEHKTTAVVIRMFLWGDERRVERLPMTLTCSWTTSHLSGHPVFVVWARDEEESERQRKRDESHKHLFPKESRVQFRKSLSISSKMDERSIFYCQLSFRLWSPPGLFREKDWWPAWYVLEILFSTS